MIGLGETDAVIDRAHRMADLETEVPEEIEHRLDHLLAARHHLVRNQEQEIEIRKGRQLAAPVSADRDQRQGLARRGIGGGIEVVADIVIKCADNAIDEMAPLAGRLQTVFATLQVMPDRAVTVAQGLLQ